jgi:hypothetical protein
MDRKLASEAHHAGQDFAEAKAQNDSRALNAAIIAEQNYEFYEAMIGEKYNAMTGLGLWDHRQDQMRGMRFIVVNLMHNRLAAAEMVGCVFDIMRPGETARQVHAGDVDAYAMPGFKHIGGC